MNKAYLLLGANIGDRLANLENAKVLLKIQVGEIERLSAIYETAAWGNTEQPSFLNQVILISTDSSAQQLMQQILGIESALGRIRTKKNASRIIDIDILFFNEEIIETPNLSIPHPEIENRNFVLYPLNELSPDFRHPGLKKTVHEILLSCTDTLPVKQY